MQDRREAFSRSYIPQRHLYVASDLVDMLGSGRLFKPSSKLKRVAARPSYQMGAQRALCQASQALKAVCPGAVYSDLHTAPMDPGRAPIPASHHACLSLLGWPCSSSCDAQTAVLPCIVPAARVCAASTCLAVESRVRVEEGAPCARAGWARTARSSGWPRGALAAAPGRIKRSGSPAPWPAGPPAQTCPPSCSSPAASCEAAARPGFAKCSVRPLPDIRRGRSKRGAV